MNAKSAMAPIAETVYSSDAANVSRGAYAFSLLSPAAAIEIMKRVRNACQGRDTMNSPEGGVRMNEMSIMAADAANGINLRIDLPSIRIE